MASVLFSKTAGLNDASYGKIDTPIRMVIMHESDELSKRQEYIDKIYIREKSRRFAETIIGGNEFSDFAVTSEGAGAENDSIEETYKQVISHLQFMKEFTITAEMMEDAMYGVGADAKLRAQNFVRAYYRTQTRFASAILANGTSNTMNFGGTNYNIGAPKHESQTVNDPLFTKSHRYGTKNDYDTQANYYYTTDLAAGTLTTDGFEAIVNELSIKLRNMKDESGNALGYAADTIILPTNRAGLETIAKKVFASYQLGGGAAGTNLASNLLYNAMTVVIDPMWNTTKNEFMIMSSEANKALGGNLFYDRVPLTVESFKDQHTANLVYTGRTRFGAGNGSYKHIIRVTDAADGAKAEELA